MGQLAIAGEFGRLAEIAIDLNVRRRCVQHAQFRRERVEFLLAFHARRAAREHVELLKLLALAIGIDAAADQCQAVGRMIAHFGIDIARIGFLVCIEGQRAAGAIIVDIALVIDIAEAGLAANRGFPLAARPVPARKGAAVLRILLQHLENRVVQRLVVQEYAELQVAIVERNHCLVLQAHGIDVPALIIHEVSGFGIIQRHRLGQRAGQVLVQLVHAGIEARRNPVRHRIADIAVEAHGLALGMVPVAIRCIGAHCAPGIQPVTRHAT